MKFRLILTAMIFVGAFAAETNAGCRVRINKNKNDNEKHRKM